MKQTKQQDHCLQPCPVEDNYWHVGGVPMSITNVASAGDKYASGMITVISPLCALQQG